MWESMVFLPKRMGSGNWENMLSMGYGINGIFIHGKHVGIPHFFPVEHMDFGKAMSSWLVDLEFGRDFPHIPDSVACLEAG